MNATTTLPETHAFASKHGLHIRTDAQKNVLLVPNGPCNPLYRDAWTAVRNDGRCPLGWSAGQIAIYHDATDTLLSVLR